MRASRQECVVVELTRSPTVQEAVQAAQADRGSQHAWYSNLRRTYCARSNRESSISRHGIARHRTVDVTSHTAHTCTKRVNQRGTKNMCLLGVRHLPARENLVNGVFQGVRLRLRTGIPEIASREIVLVRDLLVYSSREIVLVRNRR